MLHCLVSNALQFLRTVLTWTDGTSVLVDGAKRDRIVWPGDIFVSGRSIYASTGMSDGIASGLDSLLRLQLSDGREYIWLCSFDL